jgi:hypothetical protein
MGMAWMEGEGERRQMKTCNEVLRAAERDRMKDREREWMTERERERERMRERERERERMRGRNMRRGFGQRERGCKAERMREKVCVCERERARRRSRRDEPYLCIEVWLLCQQASYSESYSPTHVCTCAVKERA